MATPHACLPDARVTSENLKEAVFANVDKSAALMTDDYYAYRSVGEPMAAHGVVKYSNDEYVRGENYANTVEGFFSLLKRGINGTFHYVGRRHLARYCDEFAFRHENRKASDGERAGKIVLAAEGKRLT